MPAFPSLLHQSLPPSLPSPAPHLILGVMWHVGVGVEKLADPVPAVGLDYRAALRGGHLGKGEREGKRESREDESRDPLQD